MFGGFPFVDSIFGTPIRQRQQRRQQGQSLPSPHHFQQQHHQFHQQHHTYQSQHTQQQHQAKDVPPPASAKARANLPLVTVTADDLLEETNKECLICLEEQCIGSRSCKLPCGHLYHQPCLAEWLTKHCTCPVCRYELETDDAAYEQTRVSKMQSRKLRYRRDELEAKSIHALHELMMSLSVPSAGCIDKVDLVDRLISSGKITITEGVPALELTENQFNEYSVGELQRLLHSFGIDSSEAIEKFELRDLLLKTGRVVIVEAASEDMSSPLQFSSEEFAALSVQALRKMIVSCGLSDVDMLEKSELRNSLLESGNVVITDPIQGNVNSQSSIEKFQIHADVLRSMSVHELLDFMKAFGISYFACVEREELISRISECDKIQYMMD